MWNDGIFKINDPVLVDRIENVFRRGGVSSVIDEICKLKTGRKVLMDYGDGRKLMILLSGIKITGISTGEIIFESGITANVPVIRNINLPYVSQPLQVVFYGKMVKK